MSPFPARSVLAFITRRPLDCQANELQVDLNLAFLYQTLGTVDGRGTGGKTRRQ